METDKSSKLATTAINPVRLGRKELSPESVLQSSIYIQVISSICKGKAEKRKVTLAWLAKEKIHYENDPARYYQKSWILKVLKRLIQLNFVEIGEDGGYQVTRKLKATNMRIDFKKKIAGDEFDELANSAYLWGQIIEDQRFKNAFKPILKDIEVKLTAEWTRFVLERIGMNLRWILKDKDVKFTYEELSYIVSQSEIRLDSLLEQLGWTKEFVADAGLKEAVDKISWKSGLAQSISANKKERITEILRTEPTLEKERAAYIEFEVLEKAFEIASVASSPLFAMLIQLPSDKQERERMIEYAHRKEAVGTGGHA